MSKFVLRPCKLRADQLVPVKGAEPIELTWRELVARLAPSRDRASLRTLHYAQLGAFIGLLKHPKGLVGTDGQVKKVNFCFIAQDRSGNAAGVLYRDPSFPHRFIEAFQIEKAPETRKMSEAKGVVHLPTPMRPV